MHESTLTFMQANRIRPVIDKTFGMNEAIEAYRYFASQQHVGKVVIEL
jgi:NADPH:quinone reductase-like Zn-dependent oxidoreductase